MGYRTISLQLPTDYSEAELRRRIGHKLGLRDFTYAIENKSLDACRKSRIHWLVRVAVVSDQLHRKGTSSRNQIQRFADAVKDRKVARILHPEDRSWNFDQTQFADARIEIMGNKGALAAGFEAEVDLTRFEADFLQRKLLDWRKAKEAREE